MLLTGEIEYDLKESHNNHLEPSSFYLNGSKRSGLQVWKKSTLSFYRYNHKKDFSKKIIGIWIFLYNTRKIEKNKIFRPLPSKLLQLMQEISDTLRNKAISQLYLDAQLMKIVYFLLPQNNILYPQSKTITIKLKCGRNILLNNDDQEIIQQIHNDLTVNYQHPQQLRSWQRFTILVSKTYSWFQILISL